MYRAHPEKRHEAIQTKTTLDQLVPQDHLVRKLDRHIDFSIVHRLCERSGSWTIQCHTDHPQDERHAYAFSFKQYDKTDIVS